MMQERLAAEAEADAGRRLSARIARRSRIEHKDEPRRACARCGHCTSPAGSTQTHDDGRCTTTIALRPGLGDPSSLIGAMATTAIIGLASRRRRTGGERPVTRRAAGHRVRSRNDSRRATSCDDRSQACSPTPRTRPTTTCRTSTGTRSNRSCASRSRKRRRSIAADGKIPMLLQFAARRDRRDRHTRGARPARQVPRRRRRPTRTAVAYLRGLQEAHEGQAAGADAGGVGRGVRGADEVARAATCATRRTALAVDLRRQDRARHAAQGARRREGRHRGPARGAHGARRCPRRRDRRRCCKPRSATRTLRGAALRGLAAFDDAEDARRDPRGVRPLHARREARRAGHARGPRRLREGTHERRRGEEGPGDATSPPRSSGSFAASRTRRSTSRSPTCGASSAKRRPSARSSSTEWKMKLAASDRRRPT